MKSICKVDGCEKSVKARGLCDRHYLRARRAGELALFDGPGRGSYAPETHLTCSGVAECGKPLAARGVCNACYQLRRKTGAIKLLPLVNSGKICSVDQCETAASAAGFCKPHYERFKKYGDPLASAPRKTGGPCMTIGCDGIVTAKGLCFACYTRLKKRGTTDYSVKHLRRFEKIVDDNGYVMVPNPLHPNARKSKRVPEHRLVMSEYLGRAIRKSENIHHKNGNRADNRLENLELWTTCQPSGQRPLDLLKWAREILKSYASEETKLKKLSYRNSGE